MGNPSRSLRAGRRWALVGLVLIGVALGALVLTHYTELYWWVVSERRVHRFALHDELTRGYQYFRRGTYRAHGPRRLWYIESGRLAMDCIWHDGAPVRGTTWYPEGTVARQWITDSNGRVLERWDPPWWTLVAEQTRPTAPWVKPPATP